LLIQQFNPNTGVVRQENAIRCIQVALTNINAQKFEEIISDSDDMEDYLKRTLNTIAEENIDKEIPINLTLEERFLAFYSWVSGISEAGYNAIKIQREIEQYSKLIHPISQFFLKFLIDVDNEFIFDFLLNTEKDCTFNGKMHIPSFIANTIPIMNILVERLSNSFNNLEFKKLTKKIYDAVKSIEPPIELFMHSKDFMKIPIELEDFDIIIQIINEIDKLEKQNKIRWYHKLLNDLLLHSPKSSYRDFPHTKDEEYYYNFKITWEKTDYEYKVMKYIFQLNPPLEIFALSFEFKKLLRMEFAFEYVGANLIQHIDFIDLNPKEGCAMQRIKNLTGQLFLKNCLKTNYAFRYPKNQGYACYEALIYGEGNVLSIIIENYQLDKIIDEFLRFPKIRKIILHSNKPIEIPNSFKSRFQIEIHNSFPGFRINLYKK
jgi:hypothetical protein